MVVGGTTVGTVGVDGPVINMTIPFPKMCGHWFLPFYVSLVNCSNHYIEPKRGHHAHLN